MADLDKEIERIEQGDAWDESIEGKQEGSIFLTIKGVLSFHSFFQIKSYIFDELVGIDRLCDISYASG